MSALLATTAVTPPINGFALHNVSRVSPSSLYVWTCCPALWLMERLLDLRSPVGCAAHRGSAVEFAVVAGLLDPDLTLAECHDIALREFDRLAALSSDPRRTKEREGLCGMVTTALAELRQYGRPSSTQGKVEHRFEGLPVPILGFYDLKFDQHNLIVDLKTTHRIPSDASSQHSRQCSFYIHNTNAEARLAYVSSHKVGVYRVPNPADHVRDLVNIAQRLNRFLAISPDPYELASLLTPDVDAFWFADPMTRANAKKVFWL